jgi:hypothetical protein
MMTTTPPNIINTPNNNTNTEWVEQFDGVLKKSYWENPSTHETRWSRPTIISTAKIPPPLPERSPLRASQHVSEKGKKMLLKQMNEVHHSNSKLKLLESTQQQASSNNSKSITATTTTQQQPQEDESDDSDDGEFDDARDETLIDVVSTERPMRELGWTDFIGLNPSLIVPQPKLLHDLAHWIDVHCVKRDDANLAAVLTNNNNNNNEASTTSTTTNNTITTTTATGGGASNPSISSSSRSPSRRMSNLFASNESGPISSRPKSIRGTIITPRKSALEAEREQSERIALEKTKRALEEVAKKGLDADLSLFNRDWSVLLRAKSVKKRWSLSRLPEISIYAGPMALVEEPIAIFKTVDRANRKLFIEKADGTVVYTLQKQKIAAVHRKTSEHHRVFWIAEGKHRANVDYHSTRLVLIIHKHRIIIKARGINLINKDNESRRDSVDMREHLLIPSPVPPSTTPIAGFSITVASYEDKPDSPTRIASGMDIALVLCCFQLASRYSQYYYMIRSNKKISRQMEDSFDAGHTDEFEEAFSNPLLNANNPLVGQLRLDTDDGESTVSASESITGGLTSTQPASPARILGKVHVLLT